MKRIVAVIAFAAVLPGGVALQPAAAQERTVGRNWNCARNITTHAEVCGNLLTRRQARQRVGGKLLVRLFQHTGYRGQTVSYTGGRRCSRPYDLEYRKQDLNEFAFPLPFRNKASSVRTFNRCDVKLINIDPNPNQKSTWIDEYRNLANLGSGWNNRADRVRVS